MKNIDYHETAIYCDFLIEKGVKPRDLKELAQESGLKYVPRIRNPLNDYWHRIKESAHKSTHPMDTSSDSRVLAFKVLLSDTYASIIKKNQNELFKKIHGRPPLEEIANSEKRSLSAHITS